MILDLYFSSLGMTEPSSNPVNFAIPFVYASVANRCYYKEKVLKDRGWW